MGQQDYLKVMSKLVINTLINLFIQTIIEDYHFCVFIETGMAMIMILYLENLYGSGQIQSHILQLVWNHIEKLCIHQMFILYIHKRFYGLYIKFKNTLLIINSMQLLVLTTYTKNALEKKMCILLDPYVL